MKVIDGNNLVYGRLSTYVAKLLLSGEEVVIVNADKVAITGSRKFILNRFKERREIGSVRKGPYYPRTSNQILRRSIGDMLPKKKTKGSDALKRCKVFSGLPDEFKDKPMETVELARNEKVNQVLTLDEIAKSLGGKY